MATPYILFINPTLKNHFYSDNVSFFHSANTTEHTVILMKLDNNKYNIFNVTDSGFSSVFSFSMILRLFLHF